MGAEQCSHFLDKGREAHGSFFLFRLAAEGQNLAYEVGGTLGGLLYLRQVVLESSVIGAAF